jgi:ankyrin repeat protein
MNCVESNVKSRRIKTVFPDSLTNGSNSKPPFLVVRGFARFVNIRDGNGATPLHLAARHRRLECLQSLLDNGALVCASTGGYG